MVHNKISTDELIEELQRLDEEVEGVPATTDMREKGEFSSTPYLRRFGGWIEALEAAGIEPSQKQRNRSEGRRKATKAELLEELRQVADSLGRPPSSNEIDEHGEYSSGTYEVYFDTWNSAIEEAGLEPRHEKNVAKEVECEWCGKKLKRAPWLLEKYERNFCDRSCYMEWKGEVREERIPDEKLIQNLRELAEELGRTPTMRDMANIGPHTCKTYQLRFGSWNEALQAADLEVNQRYEWFDLECANCEDEFQKPVRYYEPDQNHFCTHDCYIEWLRSGNHPHEKHGETPYYGPNWDVQRRKALERDEYTCQSCGMSNEEHIQEYGRELNVHHITPWHEFDDSEKRNRLDNLITFCISCHRQWEGIPLRPQPTSE